MNKHYHYLSFWLGLFFGGTLCYDLFKEEGVNNYHLFLLLLTFFNLVISYLNAILDNQMKTTKQKGDYYV